MLLASVLGGAAQYLRKISAKKALFSIAELVGEAVISASAGLTAGLLVMEHAPIPVALAIASIAGHMGTRFMLAAENHISTRLRAATGEPPH